MKFWYLLLITLLLQPFSAAAEERSTSPFGWQLRSFDLKKRNTNPVPVTLDPKASAAWEALNQKGLTKKERDRLAILAMAGEYRASFDFVEVAGFTADYEPSKPYRSWGTEKVYVIEELEDKISLQHVLVMHFKDREPAVVKHWRQDWSYQPTSVLRYKGLRRWAVEPLPLEKQAGAWSQTVFQVDDSPRYGGVGFWTHEDGLSYWESETTWRPLPRREYSVRNDYEVMVGKNRHVITPNGWTHEQINNKKVLKSGKVIAREMGLNRYERIIGFDFSPGDKYWAETASFWAKVRKQWSEVLSSGEVTLKPRKEVFSLMREAFEMAEDNPSSKGVKTLVRSYLSSK